MSTSNIAIPKQLTDELINDNSNQIMDDQFVNDNESN